jgi:hypothetical protein
VDATHVTPSYCLAIASISKESKESHFWKGTGEASPKDRSGRQQIAA